MKKIILSTLLSFVCLLLPSPLLAAEFGIVPAHPDPKIKSSFSYLEYHLKQGAEKNGDFALVNLSDKPLKISLDNDDKNKIITIKQETVDIPPRRRITVPFVLKIPIHLPDGEYNFNVYGKSDSSIENSLPLNFRVYIGKKLTAKANLDKVNYTKTNYGLIVKTVVRNNGNTSLNSQGFHLVLQNKTPLLNLLFNKYEYYWGENKKILPDQSEKFTYVIKSNFAPSKYSATLTLSYGKDQSEKKTSNLTLINIFTAAGLLFKIIVASAVLFLIVKILSTKIKPFSFPIFPSLVNNFRSRRLRKKEDFSIPNLLSNKKTAPGNTKGSTIKSKGLEGLIKNIMKEEESIISAKNLSYEKIFFEVRKIVRQEIELWKEMERFRNEVRNQIRKEEEIKKRLKEEIEGRKAVG